MLDGWMENSSKNPLLGEVGILDTVYWMAGMEKTLQKTPFRGKGAYNMKRYAWYRGTLQIKILLIVITGICLPGFSSCQQSGKPKVLLFSKNTSFFHTSIPIGNAAIMKLGAENGFDVDTTTNAEYFTEDSLKKYAAVIFLNNADTSGSLLNNYQEAEFERYIQSGGGYAGIHAASDAEFGWGWYGRLVGGYFNGHPDEKQEAILHVEDSTHPATKGFTCRMEKKR